MVGIEKLARELNQLYDKYHRTEHLERDPLGMVSGQLNSADFEFVSYVSAAISYGREEQIRKSLENLWKRLGEIGLGTGGGSLHTYFVENSGKTLQKDFSFVLKGWAHRFNNEKDILALFRVLQTAAKESESLGALYSLSKSEHPTEKFQSFVDRLRKFAARKELDDFRWFACSPKEGSTCKRMVMYLRWMLRKDEIDPGTWSDNPALKKQGIGPHLAFIPMDVHVHRWATERKLLSTKSPSWKSVEEVSAVLRKVDPIDPARFDFAICHAGMVKFRAKKNTNLAI